jgi:light-regulated signal transduction histidine kinase (bacteriophytochrome)
MTMAVEGASRMRALINDLLAYSRVESGGKEFTEVDMNIALSNSLNNLDPMIVANHVEIDADHLPTVSADETQMTQVLQNLVSNAVKYHGPDRPDIRIRTVLSPNGAEWTFSVSDNGIGIDPLYQEKIFQMFQRLHTRDEYEGTGIGLAITKRIIERHGGKIWVESEEGRGSTFFFTIPRRNAEQG